MDSSFERNSWRLLPDPDRGSLCDAERQLYPLVLRVVRRLQPLNHAIALGDARLSRVARRITRMLLERQFRLHPQVYDGGDQSTWAVGDVLTQTGVAR